MWKALVARLYRAHTFLPAASAGEVAAAENALGSRFPADLRELLFESNGIEGEHGLGLVWPIARLITDNLAFRASAGDRGFMPFDNLVFFADAGNGDRFAFSVPSGARQAPNDVFAWNHEDDGRPWVAPDLKRYLEWWADGRIKL
jgi:SMI1-KNR4 cell-wall